MTSQDAVEGGLAEPTELEPAQGTLALTLDGPAATRADWEKAAATVLRKAGRLRDDDPDDSVWAKLTRTTLDGIAISPLGTPSLTQGLVANARPASPGGRDVRIELIGDDPKQLNAEALADLDGGATSLWLHAGPDTDLAAVLEGVLLDLAPVVLDPPTDAVGGARRFLDLLGDTTPPDGTNLGVPAVANDEELVAGARLAQQAGVRAVVVDASTVHDRGASEAQELGWSMAAAARVLRVLETADIAPGEAAQLVEFRYAATDEQFLTIAKLRAGRLLWRRLLELCEAEPVEQRQHAVTSRPMMSKYDPWVNMLRTTVAAFSATVGGADAVTVQPFDRPLGRPDAFGRRIARNQMALLVSESHVGTVTDPAGGAWAVERLTHDLAVAGWEFLQALETGASPEDAVAATVAERDQQVATRRRPLTGLTEFPHLGETLPERAGEPDDVRRYGAAFEALRDEPVDAPVFLATMGSVAAHTVRATFATNLLAAGGIAVASAGPTQTVDDVLAAYGGQRVVCLAGPDAAYAEWGTDLVTRLRQAGVRHVIVAGGLDTPLVPRGGSTTDRPVDDHCAVGMDALAFLRRTREVLS
jgi:methylmalonyl-CoA mutase